MASAGDGDRGGRECVLHPGIGERSRSSRLKACGVMLSNIAEVGRTEAF